MRRQDALSKALDFERLKKMKGNEESACEQEGGKKGTIESDDDDDIFGESDEEDLGDLPEPKAAVLLDSDDDDSILFDSDDEREMSKKPAKGKKAAAAKKPSEKKKATKKTKKRSRDDDEDDAYADDALDDAVSEGEEADEEEKAMEVVEEEKDESGPAELIDYLKIQTRRKFIETILSEPYFADALEGTFVRLVVGEMNGEAVYHMCEVLSVEDGPRKYQLPDTKQMTMLRMTVAIGPKTKSRVKFTDVSNRRITQEELSVYLDALGETRTGKAMTKNQVIRMKAKRDKTVAGHKYTKEEIDDMIMKKTVRKVGQTTFDIALQNIDFEMERAREANDDAALERMGKERRRLLRRSDIWKSRTL